ncbi:PilZ domain-containing protein [Marichromatium bheemlicum]|uniref:PilZ domain-containing protein n=1 Tax=Marichromatium bheemlicum TaxID=365339 RepID=A0ABX1I4R2_9GAMM|nr:PilZ domain-containing protein [Marichromatium bheemlicum]NKN32542.1 PilZ domain-containing protein [Marichromatium bheemlicum]
MRRFLRHPSDIPIHYRLANRPHRRRNRLRNIGKGGLCFLSCTPVAVGATIEIEIPVAEPAYRAEGFVAWCRPRRGLFEVGVHFANGEADYQIRMVEQVCRIEHYRRRVLATQGRALSSEQAASEWIQRYAADFPG